MKRLLVLAAALWPIALHAQTVTRIGSVATLDVAAWNVEQFQSRSPQMDNVVTVMQQSGVDLWALQEVTSPSVVDDLLSRLGDGWDGRVSASTNLHTAFVFRTDVIGVRAARPMFTNSDFDYAFAGRRPFVLEANVTLPDTTLQVMFVTLHMKCCGDNESWQRRRDAATAIKNRLDFLHPSDRLVVLGDFNDETGNSITFGRPSPYADFVSDPEYTFLIQDGNVGTFCGSDNECRTGSTIDNVLISSELDAAFIAGSGDRYDDLLSEITSYVFTTSDHLPVHARFTFPRSTAAEDLPGWAAPELFPVPARDRVQVLIPEPSTVLVHDALGRLAIRLDLDLPGETTLDLAGLSPGLYLVTISSRSGSVTKLLPRLR